MRGRESYSHRQGVAEWAAHTLFVETNYFVHLLQLGLVAAVGVDRYRLTPHARRVMRDDVRKAA